MLNYISYYLLDYLLRTDAFQRPGRDDPISKPVAESARLPELSFGDIDRPRRAVPARWPPPSSSGGCSTGRRSGFRMRAVGANPYAAALRGHERRRHVHAGDAASPAAWPGWRHGQHPRAAQLQPHRRLLRLHRLRRHRRGPARPGQPGRRRSAPPSCSACSGRAPPACRRPRRRPVDIIVVIQALIIVFVAAPALVRSHLPHPGRPGHRPDLHDELGGVSDGHDHRARSRRPRRSEPWLEAGDPLSAAGASASASPPSLLGLVALVAFGLGQRVGARLHVRVQPRVRRRADPRPHPAGQGHGHRARPS